MQREIVNSLKESSLPEALGPICLGDKGDRSHESHSQALGRWNARNLESVTINALPLCRWGAALRWEGMCPSSHRVAIAEQKQNPGRKVKGELTFLSVTKCDLLSLFTSAHPFTDKRGKVVSQDPTVRGAGERGFEPRFS